MNWLINKVLDARNKLRIDVLRVNSMTEREGWTDSWMRMIVQGVQELSSAG